MILNTRERVEVIMTMDKARGLEEGIMELDYMIYHEKDPNMKRILQIAYGKLKSRNDEAWKEVLRVAQVYLNPPYVERQVKAVEAKVDEQPKEGD